VARSPEKFRDKYDIDVRTRHEVVEIDTVAQRVKILAEGGQEFIEPYDQLLIATGAHPFCPVVPGSAAEGIFGLSTLASGLRVQDYMEREKPRKAVVVGGGYIGLEMAEAVITDQKTLPADIVLLGLGVRPNSELAETAGIELGEKKGIKVDGRMQTSCPNVWAAGDCAATVHRLTGRPIYIALGTVANKQGLVAGINLSGGQAWFPGVMGTAVSKICDVEVARTGLQETELQALGTDYVTAVIEARTRAGYYPGAGSITVKLIAEKQSGLLLGAQIVGMISISAMHRPSRRSGTRCRPPLVS
jgi:NADPH-dependent 2,4-dienoyl-CoA reductase/sulfur reductase-like enzyme